MFIKFFKCEETLTKADITKAAGRMRRNEHRGPNTEVLNFRTDNNGSTGVSHSHVHPANSRDDGHTEVHQGLPGQHSQAGNTVVSNLG